MISVYHLSYYSDLRSYVCVSPFFPESMDIQTIYFPSILHYGHLSMAY